MEQPFLILTKDATREMIRQEEIVYATVSKTYSQIKLIDNRTIRVRISLRLLENKLPPNLFLRIHKRYIICISHIKFVDTDVTMTSDDVLPISREYKEKFLSRFCVI
jgi:DNA-binding LytR/AlgR family response regulator